MTDLVPISYLLPVKAVTADPELGHYLRWLAERVRDVVVVDGSSADVYATHASWWADRVTHRRPDPSLVCANGKVWGVLTGLRLVRNNVVVIADDDVRWDLPELTRVLSLLSIADLVAPANYFDPLPWHARYDTARALIHRALGADWPGTLALRRSALERSGGYDGDVLFENLELVRTVRAAGGRVRWAQDLLVARRPPDTTHFVGQRVRQAYDEFARPAYLLAALSVLPLLGRAIHGRNWRRLLAASAAAALVAEAGRRRGGGRSVYPASSSLLAPLWVLERAVCSWLAVGQRMRGGIGYAGRRLRRAASTSARLRNRIAERRRDGESLCTVESWPTSEAAYG